jgi:hypothetical protein
MGDMGAGMSDRVFGILATVATIALLLGAMFLVAIYSI